MPDNVTAQVLSEPGVAYAVYINGSGLKNLTIELPAGKYKSQWLNTKTAEILKTESLAHTGGRTELNIPEYTDDVALRIKRSD